MLFDCSVRTPISIEADGFGVSRQNRPDWTGLRSPHQAPDATFRDYRPL